MGFLRSACSDWSPRPQLWRCGLALGLQHSIPKALGNCREPQPSSCAGSQLLFPSNSFVPDLTRAAARGSLPSPGRAESHCPVLDIPRITGADTGGTPGPSPAADNLYLPKRMGKSMRKSSSSILTRREWWWDSCAKGRGECDQPCSHRPDEPLSLLGHHNWGTRQAAEPSGCTGFSQVAHLPFLD